MLIIIKKILLNLLAYLDFFQVISIFYQIKHLILGLIWNSILVFFTLNILLKFFIKFMNI